MINIKTVKTSSYMLAFVGIVLMMIVHGVNIIVSRFIDSVKYWIDSIIYPFNGALTGVHPAHHKIPYTILSPKETMIVIIGVLTVSLMNMILAAGSNVKTHWGNLEKLELNLNCYHDILREHSKTVFPTTIEEIQQATTLEDLSNLDVQQFYSILLETQQLLPKEPDSFIGKIRLAYTYDDTKTCEQVQKLCEAWSEITPKTTPHIGSEHDG